ncbi:MAG: butyrate kinase [Spirochaeta sp.]|nr:butyrate kinase [Spirochaeta sp.]
MNYKKMKVFAINPGSTSTKTAVYSQDGEIFRKEINHDAQSLLPYKTIVSQLDFRKKAVLNTLAESGVGLTQLDAVVGRGGPLKPMAGGVYLVNEQMKEDLRSLRYGSHASNLGALLADEIAVKAGVKAFIVDPIVVDEFSPLARYSGIPEISRKSIFHALNHKATARKAARELNKEYDACNLIVVHLGGGISVGIHEKGKVVDVNNALDGDGPFAIERAGTLPAGDWMRFSLSHGYDQPFLQSRLTGKGGVVAYLGTNDARKIESTIESYLNGKESENDLDGEKCLEVVRAMCYQVAKEICSLAAVVSGNVDGIVLTGGLARDHLVVKEISGRVSFLAPVLLFPGENELESLAVSVIEALSGKQDIREYS